VPELTPNRGGPMLTTADAASDARVAPVAAPEGFAPTDGSGPSPTGTPLVPARFVPLLMVLTFLGGVPASLLGAGLAIPTAVVAIGGTVAGLAMLLLGASPGLRRRP
jgi:hypothetical protein